MIGTGELFRAGILNRSLSATTFTIAKNPSIDTKYNTEYPRAAKIASIATKVDEATRLNVKLVSDAMRVGTNNARITVRKLAVAWRPSE